MIPAVLSFAALAYWLWDWLGWGRACVTALTSAVDYFSETPTESGDE